VALVAAPSDFDDLDLIELFEDEVVAVVPDDHAWVRQPFVEPTAFDGEHVFVWHDCVERDCLIMLMAEAGATPGRVTPVPLSTEGAVGLVRAGLGVTAMARWAADPYLRQGGLAAVPVTRTGVRRRWYAATRAGAEPAYTRAFVEALRLHSPSVGAISEVAASKA